MRIDLKPVVSLSPEEAEALKALTAAVYPPEAVAAGPERHIRWARPEQSVLVWDSDGELVAHVGIVVREGFLDGRPVRIGGIGGVKTHPRVQGRGYATAALRRATSTLDAAHRVAFSLLVCRDRLIPFYERLGWLAFPGRLVVEQPHGRTDFVINRPMVLAGGRPAPPDGTIDLAGLPW